MPRRLTKRNKKLYAEYTAALTKIHALEDKHNCEQNGTAEQYRGALSEVLRGVSNKVLVRLAGFPETNAPFSKSEEASYDAFLAQSASDIPSWMKRQHNIAIFFGARFIAKPRMRYTRAMCDCVWGHCLS